MTSMKHRAKQLNGQCLVESGPGFGTVIRLTLPLEVATMQAPSLHLLPQRRLWLLACEVRRWRRVTPRSSCQLPIFDT